MPQKALHANNLSRRVEIKPFPQGERMTKYPKLEDNEGIRINSNKDTLKIACCSCGMVHSHIFAIQGNKHEKLIDVPLRKHEIAVIFVGEPRATAQLRRHNYGYLQKPTKRDKYKLVRRG